MEFFFKDAHVTSETIAGNEKCKQLYFPRNYNWWLTIAKQMYNIFLAKLHALNVSFGGPPGMARSIVMEREWGFGGEEEGC